MKIKEKIYELFKKGFDAWLILFLLFCLLAIIYLIMALASLAIYETPDRWFEILKFLVIGIAGFLFLTLLLGIVSQIFIGFVPKIRALIDKKKNKK